MKLCIFVKRSMILTPELAHTSKESEGGQNTVFQEFKEKEQKSEPQKSEEFWNKVEGLFGRGWK